MQQLGQLLRPNIAFDADLLTCDTLHLGDRSPNIERQRHGQRTERRRGTECVAHLATMLVHFKLLYQPHADHIDPCLRINHSTQTLHYALLETGSIHEVSCPLSLCHTRFSARLTGPSA
jgi:hypothetical protein